MGIEHCAFLRQEKDCEAFQRCGFGSRLPPRQSHPAQLDDLYTYITSRLLALAVEQRRVSQTGSVTDIHTTVDDRDRVLATLVTVEHELKGVRQQLLAGREWLANLPAFHEIVERHKEAADLVADIMGVDRDSLEALKEAEQARRVAAQSLEQGESTLAAYRRVVSPGLTPATLVNRRG